MAAPTITTEYIIPLAVSAIGNGNVSSDGGQSITERGIVVALTANPTTSDSKFTATGTTGVFSVAITSLTGSTAYHARAFATNASGTSYGMDVSFKTTSSLTNKARSTATLVNKSRATATITNIARD